MNDFFLSLSEVGVRPTLAHLETWLLSSCQHAVSSTYILKQSFYSVQTLCMREIMGIGFCSLS